MSDTRVVRVMTAADISDVLDVQEPGAVLGLANIFAQAAFPFPRDEVAQRWRLEVADPDVDCYVILAGGVVAGFAATRYDELLHFGTAVERWGSGLATEAHDAVLDIFAIRGIPRVWLKVFTDNRRARRFYERLGWVVAGERTHSSFPPQPELLRYEKDLEMDRASWLSSLPWGRETP